MKGSLTTNTRVFRYTKAFDAFMKAFVMSLDSRPIVIFKSLKTECTRQCSYFQLYRIVNVRIILNIIMMRDCRIMKNHYLIAESTVLLFYYFFIFSVASPSNNVTVTSIIFSLNLWKFDRLTFRQRRQLCLRQKLTFSSRYRRTSFQRSLSLFIMKTRIFYKKNSTIWYLLGFYKYKYIYS